MILGLEDMISHPPPPRPVPPFDELVPPPCGSPS
jgi:hypothetical protein